MGDETEDKIDVAVAIAVLKEKMSSLERQIASRQSREWAIIMTGVGLIGTIIAKSLGWLP